MAQLVGYRVLKGGVEVQGGYVTQGSLILPQAPQASLIFYPNETPLPEGPIA